MRSLIGNFALAAGMAALFTALVGTQLMVVSAAHQSSRTPVIDAHKPAGPSVGAISLHPPA
jgi:hypothetical protein